MAVCAKLDILNQVIETLTVDDSIVDKETYCINTFGGIWKNASNAVRNGDTFDAEKNVFIPQKPFPSWTLNSNNIWVAPVSFPTIVINTNATPIEENVYPTYAIKWSEPNLRWQSVNENEQNIYWDNANNSWIIF
jgi:hypothetical protein